MQLLQGEIGILQDFVFPLQQLPPEIFQHGGIHIRLFFRGLVIGRVSQRSGRSLFFGGFSLFGWHVRVL